MHLSVLHVLNSKKVSNFCMVKSAHYFLALQPLRKRWGRFRLSFSSHRGINHRLGIVTLLEEEGVLNLGFTSTPASEVLQQAIIIITNAG